MSIFLLLLDGIIDWIAAANDFTLGSRNASTVTLSFQKVLRQLSLEWKGNIDVGDRFELVTAYFYIQKSPKYRFSHQHLNKVTSMLVTDVGDQFELVTAYFWKSPTYRFSHQHLNNHFENSTIAMNKIKLLITFIELNIFELRWVGIAFVQIFYKSTLSKCIFNELE